MNAIGPAPRLPETLDELRARVQSADVEGVTVTDDQHIYLHITGAPLLGLCLDWVRRSIAHRKAAFRLAKAVDPAIPSVFIGGFDNSFIGLAPRPDGKTPPGWMVKKSKRRDAGAVLIPAKGNAGDAAREMVRALPVAPKTHEPTEWLKHPGGVSWRAKNAFGSRAVGGLWPVELFFPSGNGPFFLRCADPHPVIANLLRSYPDAVIESGRWTPPRKGVSRISKERVDFLIAKANLEAKERRAA